MGTHDWTRIHPPSPETMGVSPWRKAKKSSAATADSANTEYWADEPGEAKREVPRRETKQFSEDGSLKQDRDHVCKGVGLH